MSAKSYRLNLAFGPDTPATLSRVVEIEEKLRRVCSHGATERRTVDDGIVCIHICTRRPWECFNECMQHLVGFPLVPISASYRQLVRDRAGRIRLSGPSLSFEVRGSGRETPQKVRPLRQKMRRSGTDEMS